MKYFLLIATFFIAATVDAQNSDIKGSVYDFESNNEPLMFAKVSIKETGAETMTDEYGKFQFESLPEGTYTLVYTFVGYSKKEVIGKPHNILRHPDNDKKIFKERSDQSVYLASSLVGNTGNLGIPLGIAIFGIESVPYTSIINIGLAIRLSMSYNANICIDSFSILSDNINRINRAGLLNL